MYQRSTSKKRAAEAEKEARMEEKEATLAEDVEEMLLAIEDRQPEPAEEVQQLEGEPEITQQETQPKVSQPEKPEQPGSTDIMQEMYRLCLLYTSILRKLLLKFRWCSITVVRNFSFISSKVVSCSGPHLHLSFDDSCWENLDVNSE